MKTGARRILESQSTLKKFFDPPQIFLGPKKENANAAN